MGRIRRETVIGDLEIIGNKWDNKNLLEDKEYGYRIFCGLAVQFDGQTVL